jgi:DNA-binding beta-propeller fold protein YncE
MSLAAEMSSMRHHQIQPSVVTQLANVTPMTVSTVPANGDVNPYGVAYVPNGFPRGGSLRPGDVLVSNFNASSNLQGTGTTIVSITPQGQQSVFFQGQPGVGLTSALAVLKSGFVIVGNMPTSDGTSATVQPGSLLVINRQGQQVANLANPSLVNGPWGLAVNDQGNHGQVFVSNVLNGTIERFNYSIGRHGQFSVTGATQIGSGFNWRADPAALEIGPTGLAFNPAKNVLYVASTLENSIYAIPNASKTHNDMGEGQLVTSDSTHLHGPLGMTLDPINGNIIVANGDAINADPNQPSEIVEFTPSGQFVNQFSIDTGSGGPFGIGLGTFGRNILFTAVDDLSNTAQLYRLSR